MERIFLKDKKDFIKHYEDEDIYFLKEFVFWRDSIVQDKVDVKIAIPCYRKEIEKVLNKIKD